MGKGIFQHYLRNYTKHSQNKHTSRHLVIPVCLHLLNQNMEVLSFKDQISM